MPVAGRTDCESTLTGRSSIQSSECLNIVVFKRTEPTGNFVGGTSISAIGYKT